MSILTIQRWVEQGSSCRAYAHLTDITTSNSFRQSLNSSNQQNLCHGSLHRTIVLDLLCRVKILRLRRIAWDANKSGCTCTWEELDKPKEFAAQGQALRRGPLQRFRRCSYIFTLLPILPWCLHIESMYGIEVGASSNPGSLWSKIQIASSSITLTLELNDSTLCLSPWKLFRRLRYIQLERL